MTGNAKTTYRDLQSLFSRSCSKEKLCGDEPLDCYIPFPAKVQRRVEQMQHFLYVGCANVVA